MSGFRDWIAREEKVAFAHDPKTCHSPSPTGMRKGGIKPPTPSRLVKPDSVFKGFNAFGMPRYATQKSGAINPNG